GQIGAGALLANYSRDNERDADSIGMDYMEAAGHNPEGMVGLASMLNSLSARKPNAIEIMFASHPTSAERLEIARRQVQGYSQTARARDRNTDRFLAMTESIRALKPAIDAMQEGERLLAQGDPSGAEASLARAVELAPDDYTGLMLMGKLQLTQEREERALEYFGRAAEVLPNEGQAVQYQGLANLGLERYDRAIEYFLAYEEQLPGNPGLDFLLGYSYDSQNEREPAAERYRRYLQQVQQGPQAEHAYRRLTEWGMI
ncbi:MAG: tetratricopeptide repeat protein, partial [Natronospirillum sp.]